MCYDCIVIVVGLCWISSCTDLCRLVVQKVGCLESWLSRGKGREVVSLKG